MSSASMTRSVPDGTDTREFNATRPVARMAVEYLSLEDLVVYSGMSRSTLKRYLTDPANPLPRMSLPHEKIRVRRSEFERWYEARRRRHEEHNALDLHAGDSEADRIAGRFLAKMQSRLPHQP
jgi:predicted DNA-binding transcriptional regulator AlpA